MCPPRVKCLASLFLLGFPRSGFAARVALLLGSLIPSTLFSALFLGALPATAAEGHKLIPFASPVTTPIVISTPGKYVVTRNLTATGAGAVIEIAVPTSIGKDVHLDLNGFVLTASSSSPAILVSGGVAGVPPIGSEVTIRNGVLVGGSEGILVSSGSAKVLIEDVKVSDSSSAGIKLTDVTSFAIRRCTLLRTGSNAIYAVGPAIPPIPTMQGTIQECHVKDCAGGISITKGSSVAILNNRLENMDATPAPLEHGGITFSSSDTCLVSNNTVEVVAGPSSAPPCTLPPGSGGGDAIRLVNTHGCKLYNNVVAFSSRHGILLDAGSFDNLLLDNVVKDSGSDGVRVMARGNHIDRNVMNKNGTSGLGWGLHFCGSGAKDNNFGRNTGFNNMGPATSCSFAVRGAPPALPKSKDFCDDNGSVDFENFSFHDNLMPGRTPGPPPYTGLF